MKNGKKKVRLCINYKLTINDYIEDEPYNFPTVAQQLEKLKGDFFSCLDIKGAYKQIKVYEPHRKFLTAVTPRGYFEPERLQFGIKTAPKIFQSAMDQLLAGIPSVACIVDDICVTGKTPEEHFRNLETVLERLEKAGLKLNKEKCHFYQPEVKYLGRIISKDGIAMDPEVISAIANIPEPKSRQELQSFLGHMSYVTKHVPGLSSVTAVLSELLKKDVAFIWTDVHKVAFNRCKELASNMATLAHYDESRELVLTTDASPVGVGALLAHREHIGNKSYLRPIAYASRTLTPTERNYAQVDREGAAVVWAVRHFRQFLYCRHFILQTDCSALTRIFGPKNNLNGCAVGRLQRWAIELMEYDFTPRHIKGDMNKIADNLSRLPQPTQGSLLIPEERSIMVVNCLATLPADDSIGDLQCNKMDEVAALSLEGLPLTAAAIAKATRDNPIYGKVLDTVKSGEWRNLKDEGEEGSFKKIRDSLTTDSGCIMHGNRIVVPPKFHVRLLEELHETHMGAVKMKSLAREYVWWPHINRDIEGIVSKCVGCAKHKSRPSQTSLTHWPWATRPMERVHLDFAEYKGVMILVAIDFYTKYIWAVLMHQNTKANRLISVLDIIFADRGLPTTVVTDNGPQFTSELFSKRMKSWGVKHVLTPPYHPSSNGSAERAVGCLKQALYKMNAPASLPELQESITKFLMIYRSTPHTTTHRTPHEMMKDNIPKTKFSLIKPSQERDLERQYTSKISNVDGKTSVVLRNFQENDSVLVYNKLTKRNEFGKVVKVCGKNTYEVAIGNSTKLVSADHLSPTEANPEIEEKPPEEQQSPSESEDSDDDSPQGIIGVQRQHCAEGAETRGTNRIRRTEVEQLLESSRGDRKESRTRPSNKNMSFSKYF